MALASRVGARVRDTLRHGYGRVGPRLLFLALIAVMRLAETQTSKHWLETQTYSVAQWVLGLFSHADGVVVIDIADLPPEKGVTPRQALLDLMSRLQVAGASAIGVDIDFSPENNLFVAPDDPRFFSDCLSFQTRFKIPVYLGVARTAGNGREAWLGRREFAPLAAGIVIPDASGTVSDGGAPGPYPLFIPRLDDTLRLEAESSGTKLLSMAMALASVVKADIEHELTTPGRISEPAVERAVIKGVSVPEFPVNYGFIRQLQQASIPSKEVGPGKLPVGPRGEGPIVLIGDLKGSSRSDVFTTRGSAASASGVLIHASATLTLMRTPLSVLNEWARGGLELALLLGIGAAMGKPRKRLTPKQWQWIRRGLAAAVAITVLGLFYAGILWLDWLAVLLVAVIHSFLKRTEEPAVEDAAHSGREVVTTS